MRLKVLPYKQGSRSARALARRLGCKVLKLRGSSFRPRSTDLVINWGQDEVRMPCRVLNRCTVQAGCKIQALRILKEGDVPCPESTVDPAEARGWLFDDNKTVLARHLTRASEGRGIEIYNGRDDYDRFVGSTRAPLYVQYIKKRHEYRVHVFNGEVIDTQMKRRRRETPDEEVNWQIRNHCNGFIFAREDVQPCDTRDAMAVRAIQCLGLDFGAVDMIWNEHENQYYVLEVNTAPGLEGSTLDSYSRAVQSYISYNQST